MTSTIDKHITIKFPFGSPTIEIKFSSTGDREDDYLLVKSGDKVLLKDASWLTPDEIAFLIKELLKGREQIKIEDIIGRKFNA